MIELDITKAIDAASGFAQALETQDLEPKVENAVKKSDETDEDESDES